MTAVTQSPNSLKRDSIIMALVGSAHFISHFFQLSLPPLFPLLHDYFNVSYVELGSVLTVFYLVSGICQAFAGILVDKYGARPVLMTGILLMATSIGIAGFVPQFWMFYPLMACAAVGNSVFHPADLAALSHQVSKKRLGRAFSIHAAAGRFGFAAGPLVVGTIAAMGHWRIALITAGLLGWGVALLFFRFSHHFVPDHGDAHHNKPHVKISYRQLITTPAILFAMGYFIFTVAAGSGFQAFSSVSFVNFFHMPLQTAATALSVYFVSSAVGMLLGGVIADHTPRHVLVAVLGLFGCCVFVGLLAVNILPFALIMVVICLIGLCDGVTAPSRDILIKGAAPPGATGRVFGLVYSGVDAGGTIGPLLFGILADAQAYQALFLTIALLYACGIPFVIPIGQRQVTKTA